MNNNQGRVEIELKETNRDSTTSITTDTESITINDTNNNNQHNRSSSNLSASGKDGWKSVNKPPKKWTQSTYDAWYMNSQAELLNKPPSRPPSTPPSPSQPRSQQDKQQQVQESKGEEGTTKKPFTQLKLSDLKDQLKNKELYKDVFWVSIFNFAEVILITLFGVAYSIAVSYIPFTNTDTEQVWRNPELYFNPYPASSIFFLTGATVIIIIGWGFFILLYGFHTSRSLLYYTVLPGLFATTWFFILIKIGVRPWYYVLDMIYYGLIGIIFFFSARIIGKKVNFKNITTIFSIPLGVHILIVALYSFLIFPFYRLIDSVIGKSLIRLILHPVLMQINLLVSKTFVKKYVNVKYPHLATGIVFGILVESALFGRFLIATINDPTATIVTSFLTGFIEIGLRLTVTLQSDLLKFLAKKVLNITLPEETDQDRKFHAQFTINQMVVEKSSILTIPFLLHFFWKHRMVFNFSFTETPPDLKLLIGSAFIQLAIDIGVDFICIIGETIQRIPVFQIYKEDRKKYLVWEILNYIQICTLIIYVLRTLPSKLYCDSESPCSCKILIVEDLFPFCNANVNGTMLQ